MKVPFVDLKREALLLKTKLQESTLEVLSSGNYINGPRVKKFEDNFDKIYGKDLKN